MRLLFLGSALLAATLSGGCGMGKDDTIEPPAELVELRNELDVERLWSSKVGGKSENLRLGLEPATDGANIFAGSYDGRIEALNADTGRMVWADRTDLALSAGPGYGNGMLAFGTADGQILLLDATNGQERWRQPVGSEILAPPAIGANVVVFRSVDGRLRGLSVSDGRTLWTVEQNIPPLTLRGDTPPQIAGQIVVSGFDNGRVGAYNINTGDTLWEIPLANPTGTNDIERLVDISGGLRVVGNDVYTVGYHGRAVSIDLNSGVVVWQQEMSSFAGIGVDLNNVYVTDDVSAVVALDRRRGSPVWRQEALRLRDVTAPTRFGRAVVVGDLEGYVHWLDPQDGHFLARTRAASDRISGPPLVIGDRMFIQADDGTVAAYTLRDDSA